MKKILAVLLCLMCLVSSMAVSVSAASEFEKVFVEIGAMLGFEPDEPIGYGIRYNSNKILSGISSLMYEPKPTVKLRNPGTYTVTDDFPLSVDHSFVCWEDRELGKYYYPGDKIYIDGEIILYAVWEEKTDNNIRPVRVFLTAFQALKKTFQAFFGVFKVDYVEDLDAVPAYWFDAEFSFTDTELQDGIGTGREFVLRVKTPDGVAYSNFDKTEPIFFGGSMEVITDEEYVYKKDADGNYVTDEKGNRIIESVIPVTKKQLMRSTEYSAAYSTMGVKEGEYQIINISLTDRVPNPSPASYVTFYLPRGILRYEDADGKMHYSNETSVTLLSSRNAE